MLVSLDRGYPYICLKQVNVYLIQVYNLQKGKGEGVIVISNTEFAWGDACGIKLEPDQW